jgi:hypothetical protein
MNELIFLVEEAPEGGFTARARRAAPTNGFWSDCARTGSPGAAGS